MSYLLSLRLSQNKNQNTVFSAHRNLQLWGTELASGRKLLEIIENNYKLLFSFHDSNDFCATCKSKPKSVSQWP